MNNELTMVNENDEVITGGSVGIVVDGGINMVLDLTQPKVQAYCSIDVEKLTDDQQVDFFNAINSTENHVGDYINKVLEIKHVYCEMVTLTDKETGKQAQAPRTVLIDKDGVGYSTCSKAVFGSLSKLFEMCGQPQTWKSPKRIEIKQVKSGSVNKCLTLALAKADPKTK